ncbi:ABC transporter permease [Shewanella mangrovi]|uniref:ABC transporter permease n=1 Tax=Shewanella mangrovi TaxID=1515746 RepID=A0A094JDB4_9GAMM|nr:Gldg family protein [Shewanella mangrovi]KFZ36044.1 ABC transporter permease [Shewanella mangrovi]
MAEWQQIARKEFRAFFNSPAAILFLGTFIVACLFVVFWVAGFFARNIADVRPLFNWIPLLLIFLVAALTMRSWSEEQRAGTLESLLTSPVNPLTLIIGKFAAMLGLVAIALLLTLPLPITVSLMGPLDWGPVIGGYVASLFLAAAYIAIGLYMSSRTDNAIVALILTLVVCGLFYLIGSPQLTNLFGYHAGDILRGLGTGSRFDSITRGVLDLRDLYYYLSLVGIFLALNMLRLERIRWAGNQQNSKHRQWRWVTALVVINFIAGNLWLNQVHWARLDMTQGQQYTLSEASKHYLAQLQEPLLIRGYFSAKTHPLLAPLVPQIKDLLQEYAVASGNKVHVEFIDPQKDQRAEQQAASRYGIKPLSFETANKYSAGVMSSYFNVVIAYGDKFKVLNYQDLIDVKGRGDHLDVLLKNPEYTVTSAIRNVMHQWQAGGNPFDTIHGDVVFHGYISGKQNLPAPLQKLRSALNEILSDLTQQAAGKLQTEFADPLQNPQLASTLKQEYGFAPQVMGLTDRKPFWFYMTLENGGSKVQIPLPEKLDKATLKHSIQAALQRLAPGFMKTVALAAPKANYMSPSNNSYSMLREELSKNLKVEDEDLSDGTVSQDADFLLVMAPKNLDEKSLFAIDQFLMRGGSVMIATSPYDVNIKQGLTAQSNSSGLSKWLAHFGMSMDSKLVLDPRNAALPIPVNRNVGGITIRQVQMMPYAYFPDLRDTQLDGDNPVTASLGQLTLNWASPLSIDNNLSAKRDVSTLLRSSDHSWLSAQLNLVPDYRSNPQSGFKPEGKPQSYPLAVAETGAFDSFFAGKASPLLNEQASGNKTQGKTATTVNSDKVSSLIAHSPESARLIVIASNGFASDNTLSLESQGLSSLYNKPIDFIQNSIDWSLEDPALLSLRGHTQFARTLVGMKLAQQQFWEYLNYGLAVLCLLLVWLWRRQVKRADTRRYQQILAEV